ncbi:hypothetical protein ACEQ8H_006959 [Pleosporales sp. CAS-2024a]
MFAKSLALASVISTSIAGSMPLIRSPSTLPDVTIKPLPAGCASYPGYDADSNTAGPWSLTVSDAENPALVNMGPTTSYSLAVNSQGQPVMRWGYVNLGTRVDIARNAFQCSADTLTIYTPTSVNAAGAPGDYHWTPAVLSPYAYDASLMYLIDGAQPTLYQHWVGGEKQDGWYLGGYNTSTWGAKWYEAEPTSHSMPYYYVRLLPAGQGLQANETRIFLKIQA